MEINKQMPKLVEPRTYRHMCLTMQNVQKKNNGENLVRVIIIVVIFFLLLQAMYHTNEIANSEKESKTHHFLPAPTRHL